MSDIQPEHFPNAKDSSKVFTRERIIAKIKRMKISYRMAVEADKKVAEEEL